MKNINRSDAIRSIRRCVHYAAIIGQGTGEDAGRTIARAMELQRLGDEWIDDEMEAITAEQERLDAILRPVRVA